MPSRVSEEQFPEGLDYPESQKRRSIDRKNLFVDRDSQARALMTSAPAILPVAPHSFSSFLTTTHGRFVLQPMLAISNAPFNSIEANLSTLLEIEMFLILSLAVSARVQRSRGR
jgi:hypothetical protein